jgi:hypothetical protein
MMVTILMAVLLTECWSDASPGDITSCGVYSGTPCATGTLVPQSGNGCLGTVCPSGQVCGGTQPPGGSFSCSPGPLACGQEEFTTLCTSDSDCAGMATCSAGLCIGTACPSGQQCSAVIVGETCKPAGDAGTLDAGADASPDAG